MAAPRPIQTLSVTLVTTAEVNAPPSSMPSMAMFTTPDRSQRTPESAPNTIGTARLTDACSTPVRLIDWPAATQTRKVKTKRVTTAAEHERPAGAEAARQLHAAQRRDHGRQQVRRRRRRQHEVGDRDADARQVEDEPRRVVAGDRQRRSRRASPPRRSR